MQGLHLRFSRTIRDLVDIDYWDKLSDSQMEWIKAFLEAEYNAKPPKTYSEIERKNSYRRKYIARNDIFSWPREQICDDSDVIHSTNPKHRNDLL